MRAEQKLVRHGNATGVSIPKQILVYLGWLPGERVVIELLEDMSLRLRLRDESDFARIRAPRLVYDDHGKVTGTRLGVSTEKLPGLMPDAELVGK